MRTFFAQFPDVAVRARQASSAELANELSEGKLDAAFIRPPLPNQREFRLQTILDEDMVVVLPHDHRLEPADAVKLSALSNETFTLTPRSVSPGYYDTVISALHEAGLSPRIGQEAATIAALPSMVAAGFGVSILPRSVSQIQIANVVYRPIIGRARTRQSRWHVAATAVQRQCTT